MDRTGWVDALLEAAPPAVRAAAEREALGAAVERLIEQAEVGGDPVGFCAHVGACLDADAEPVAALAGLAARDLGIAYGCSRGDPEALEVFEREHLTPVLPALARMGASAATIDEQAQALRARLLVGDAAHPAQIRDYRGQGGLRRWVRAVLVHQYLNAIRDTRREVGVEDETVLDALADPGTDPRLAYLKQRYRDSFAASIDAAAAGLQPAERAVLHYTFVDGLNLDALGRALRISRASAHRRLTAAREALLAGTERELQARLALTPEEVVSLHRLVRSQLELSMGRIFAR